MLNTVKLIYSKFTPNLYWSFASKGIAAVAFICIDILLARSLEPSLYGEWNRFFSLISILTYLVYFGIPAATEAFTAQNSDRPELKQVLKDSLLLQILFSGAATGVVLLLRNQIAVLVDKPHFGALILLALPYLFASTLQEYLKRVFVGLKRARYHFYMNLFSFGLRLVFLLLLLLFFKDIPYIIYAYTISIIAAVIVGILMYAKQYKNLSSLDSPQPAFLAKIFKYSFPLGLIMIIGLSLPEINVQLLGTLSSSTEVAYLSVGKQLTSKLPQIAMAVSMGVMPDYAQISAETMHTKKKSFLRILKLNLILFGGLAGGIILFSPWAVPLIYGDEYANAVLPLQILSVSLITSSNGIYLGTLLNYQGKAAQRAVLMVLSVIVNIVLNLLLIPKLGAVGSALALILTSVPRSLIFFFYGWNIFKE